MPIYEYRCEACGERFEQLRRMSDADTGLRCPRCESEQIQRQVSVGHRINLMAIASEYDLHQLAQLAHVIRIKHPQGFAGAAGMRNFGEWSGH